MKRLRTILLLSFTVALLFSCEKKSFSLSSVSLIEEEGSLFFSFSSSDVDSSYELSLKSPSSLLSWQSGMNKGEDGVFMSPPLEITEGASFERGTYSYVVYSSSGTELEGSVAY